MGSSSGGGGSDSTKLGKIAPPGVARPYIPHPDVNHALPGNWMPRGGQMAPHGTINPEAYTDTPDMIYQAGLARQNQSLMFEDILRQLGLPQPQRSGAQPTPFTLPSWGPQQIPTPPPAPLSPAGPYQPFEIHA